MRRLLIFFILATLAPGATVAMALVDQKTFTVSATVQTPASITVSADPIAFGDVIETDSPDHSGCTPGFSTIHVTATAGRQYTIVHDSGILHSSQMQGVANASERLSYILFTGPSHSGLEVFGELPLNPIYGTGTGTVQHIPIYAGVPPTQHVANQNYADTVTITATLSP